MNMKKLEAVIITSTQNSRELSIRNVEHGSIKTELVKAGFNDGDKVIIIDLNDYLDLLLLEEAS